MNDSKFHYVDDPSIDIGPDGAHAVVWVDNRRQTVFFQRFDASGDALLDAPEEVSDSPEVFSWLPRVVVDPNDSSRVFVLWQEIVFSGGSHGGEAFFARSTDGGETFEEPVNLSESIAGDGKGRLTKERWDNGSLDLEVTADGTILAAWTEYEGRLWFARSTDGGASFSKKLRISGTEPKPARGPSLAVESDSKIWIAWAVGEDEEADIRLAASDDAGQSFSDASTAVQTDGHSDAPSLAVDSDGRLHLMWAESPTGMFGRYHVRYARGSGALDESRALTDPVDGAAAHFPTLAIDHEGRLFAVWEHKPAGAERAVALGWARSNDGGDTFTEPTLVPGTETAKMGFNGSLQGGLMRKIAVRDGHVGVVNSRFDAGEVSRVRLIRARSITPSARPARKGMPLDR
ncbi:MAG: sialidase family protein [Myxococcota bacterium]